ncbi:MAG: hypothetical protein TRG1_1791 [Flavobacteriaceae bacterium FS1-H7996/R]|nr:MAG: hypothetical protein TRG1_1791 [Flavobacteriaceae bacterium FS1-H7996/R]
MNRLLSFTYVQFTFKMTQMLFKAENKLNIWCLVNGNLEND